MATTVWRFPFAITPKPQSIPANVRVCRILHVGLDPQSKPSIWAEVDPAFISTHKIRVQVVGTGGEVPWRMNYRGTFQVKNEAWHIYTAVVL